MKTIRFFNIAILLAFTIITSNAHAFDSMTGPLAGVWAAGEALKHTGQAVAQAPAAGQIETAFSPDGASEALVLKVIQSARQTVRLAAYSFTSPVVVRALIDAKRRGVEVAVVVDHKNNINIGRSGKGKAALNLLVNAGIPTRTIARYAIHHDKFIVVDGLHVETGSFNYSEAAARRNS